MLDLEGNCLGVSNSDKTRVHFVQGGADYLATLSGGEGENVNDEQGEIEHLDVNVPGGLISGWRNVSITLRHLGEKFRLQEEARRPLPAAAAGG